MLMKTRTMRNKATTPLMTDIKMTMRVWMLDIGEPEVAAIYIGTQINSLAILKENYTMQVHVFFPKI